MNFSEERAIYQKKCEELIEKNKKQELDLNCLYIELTKLGDSFFTNIETIVRDRIDSEIFSKADSADLLITIEEVFETAISHCNLLKQIEHKLNINESSIHQILSFLQIVYKSNSVDEKVIEYKLKFTNADLSIDGFINKDIIKMKKTKCNIKGVVSTTIVTLLLIIGVLIYSNVNKNTSYNVPMLVVSIFTLGVTIVLCFIKFVNDSSTYLIFRILSSIFPSLGLVSLANVAFKITITTGVMSLDAIGVAGLTIFFYLVKPAKPQEYKTDSELEKDK